MKMYALLMVALLALSGCKTSYEGSIKGSGIQEPSEGTAAVQSEAAPEKY